MVKVIFHEGSISLGKLMSYSVADSEIPSQVASFQVMMMMMIIIIRSTSESRPNSIEGKNVRPPVRTSVRPSVHKKFLQFE